MHLFILYKLILTFKYYNYFAFKTMKTVFVHITLKKNNNKTLNCKYFILLCQVSKKLVIKI